MADFRAVKPIVVLIAIACPLRAELLATFHTTLGDVVVALQYDKAPQTAANFITLAEGARPWVDPLTGAVRSAPFYNGIKIHRTANSDSFRFAQGGSPKGDGSDGPGYTFRDEFDPSLTHVPYVLSMANSGPNTNGSQFFFTGSLSQTTYNNVHTIFGLVTDPASRGVVDAMIAAGANGTTITGIGFTHTDAAAIAFDEHAQHLPACSAVAGNLLVTPGVEVKYAMTAPLPPGSVFQVFRSTDLQSWSRLGQAYQGTGTTGDNEIAFDNGTLPNAFYQLSLTRYPDALAPASLANKTLTVAVGTSDTIIFNFDATGNGGTATYSASAGAPGSITSVSYSCSPYKATWVIYSTSLIPLRFVATLNSETATEVLGTQRTDQWNGLYWSTTGSGPMLLTK